MIALKAIEQLGKIKILKILISYIQRGASTLVNDHTHAPSFLRNRHEYSVMQYDARIRVTEYIIQSAVERS